MKKLTVYRTTTMNPHIRWDPTGFWPTEIILKVSYSVIPIYAVPDVSIYETEIYENYSSSSKKS